MNNVPGIQIQGQISRAFYSNTISGFINSDSDKVIGRITLEDVFRSEQSQRDAWNVEIQILKNVLQGKSGSIHFEYSIPRLGKRIDVVLIINSVVFVLEFKVGDTEYSSDGQNQALDYALDLKYFHEPSHNLLIAPILVATNAQSRLITIVETPHEDKILWPLCVNGKTLGTAIDQVLEKFKTEKGFVEGWFEGRYSPTPTIIEAATALYNGHSVLEISRSDAGAINLKDTTTVIEQIIEQSKEFSRKAICFVTGVPGAGKTLVGLNIATNSYREENQTKGVFLSGNGPLVAILREALARDKVSGDRKNGKRTTKGSAHREVKMFIQPVHHFRDACLTDIKRPPIDHFAIFDEAQRAWNKTQTANFMSRKKRIANFAYSESEFLISCLDRHPDWAVVVCLVGGGQEIHTGEAGISEWIDSINRSFPTWDVYISPELTDSEYGAGKPIKQLKTHKNVNLLPKLHLAISMRSFRSEKVSLLIKQILDLDETTARLTHKEVVAKYPIILTRDLHKAKQWLKEKARGSERYGMVVSSYAERLKPYAIDVKSPMDPVHWFLEPRTDVRSSYYLEDVATEFVVQGLELDWGCVVWDADFRFGQNGWSHWSFKGNRWEGVNKAERKIYQKNAYRVLLTRSRQGMVIVVPTGDESDATRPREYYDSTYEYLSRIGFDIL